MDISLTRLTDRHQLGQLWQALQSRADHTFFTSWAWMGNWLDQLPAHMEVHLLRADLGGHNVGLGLLVKGQTKVLRFLPVSCWRLHNTGDLQIDDLVIEYNDFLVDRAYAGRVRRAMLAHLFQAKHVQRLEIARAHPAMRDALEDLPAPVTAQQLHMACHIVDLEAVRAADAGGYLSLLSSNTRSQIRRSLNAYAKLGPLQLDVAADVDQGLAFFDALKGLHTQTWLDRGEDSTFASCSMADNFHRQLIRAQLPSGQVQLLRVRAGEATLGYLYNFVYGTQVLYYQSGFHYGLLDKHDKPGMTCHTLAAQHYADQGLREYNLTAGSYRYKASLATHSEMLTTCSIYRQFSLSNLEQLLRQLRNKIQSGQAALQKRLASRTMALMAVSEVFIVAEDLLQWM
jgi:CelD/BcsL family acetyltransferase involved in cellulose biosynthesis